METFNVGLSYEDLVARVSRQENPQPALLFWLRHYGIQSAQLVWEDCPRADWLEAIAAACGVPPERLQQIGMQVREALEERREAPSTRKHDGAGWYTPTLDGARLFRQRLSWPAVASEARRTRPREDNPRGAAQAESFS